MQFAQRVEKIKPSPTLALNARAKKMQAEGIDVINFTCGEPDFDTPEHIKLAAVAALKEGFTKYTPSGGIAELKDAIARALKREQGISYKREEIIVTPGAKYAIYAAMQAILNPGDEVLIPAPYWVSYPDQAILSDATPVIVSTSEKNDFKITPAELEKHVTGRTKILVLNSPSNPTGMAYAEDETAAIAEFCLKHNLWIISDEIYDGIVFDGFRCKTMAAFAKEKTVVVNGVSKKFAMTGWRMGFAAAPAMLIAKMTDIQGQMITSVTSITQKACVAAYDGPQDEIQKMVAAFCERRNVMIGGLNAIGLPCKKPHGTFYAFPSVKSLGRKSADVAETLLTDAHVATVPGEAFGTEGFIRLSFATSMEKIKEGLGRIQKHLAA